MKYLYLILFYTCAWTLSAQQVEESKVSISLGNQAAYYVEVDGADDKAAERILKDFLKDQFDSKVKRNKKAKEWFAEKVQLRGVNKGAPLDLYIKVEKGKGLTSVYFVADRGDAFISSNDTPDDHKPMAMIVQDYGYELKRYVVNEELKESEKQLERFEKDLEKLQNKNDGYHKDIEKAEKKIAEAKDDIEKNVTEQENKRAEIEAQIQAVETLKNRFNEIGKN